MMKKLVKNMGRYLCYMVVLPSGIMVNVEKHMNRSAETWFAFFAQFWALVPGLPGNYLRAAFYRQVLDFCDKSCVISFGAICTHRQVRIEKNVYIGPYSLIGSAWIKAGTLIGSRVSVTSGKRQHTLDDTGHWRGFDAKNMVQVHIGPRAWIGEGAVVMADVGETSMVGAGAVVAAPVPDHVLGAGNPFQIRRQIHEN
jgi:acetyltransferase-like isoleucine patch superfamily enzyme